MASEVHVVKKCWICPDTFLKNKELKDHAVSKHSVCKMICPWCWEDEKTFGRMSELTKHAKRKHPDLVLELTEGDFFTEKNGFWLSLRPADYARVITPGDWTSNIAIRTRAAVLGWVDRCKVASRTREQWEAGWKQALGMEVSTPSKKRKYSPSRPNIDYPELTIERILLTSKSKESYLRMVEAKAEVWFKAEFVHWIVEDRKAMDNLLRRMTCLKEEREPPKEFSTELKTEDAKFTVRQVSSKLGIGERHIRRLYRGTIRFDNICNRKEEETRVDIGEEPEYEIMDVIEEHSTVDDQNLTEDQSLVEDRNIVADKPKTDQHQNRKVVMSVKENNGDDNTETQEKDEEAELDEDREALDKGHEVHMRICQEEDINGMKVRAEKLLLRGGMPLFPPGRREWGSQQVLISTTPTEMFWPPENWEKLSSEERLTSWRFAAMALEREEGTTACTSEGPLLDKYAMLALPGTAVGKSMRKGGTAARTSNYNVLLKIWKGNMEDSEAKDWIEMFEAATSRTKPHHLVGKLEHIPLRLRTDKEKDTIA